MKPDTLSVMWKTTFLLATSFVIVIVLGAAFDSDLAQIAYRIERTDITPPRITGWLTAHFVGNSNTTEGAITRLLISPWILLLAYVIGSRQRYTDRSAWFPHFLGTFACFVVGEMLLLGLLHLGITAFDRPLLSLWIERAPPTATMRFVTILFWVCIATAILTVIWRIQDRKGSQPGGGPLR